MDFVQNSNKCYVNITFGNNFYKSEPLPPYHKSTHGLPKSEPTPDGCFQCLPQHTLRLLY